MSSSGRPWRTKVAVAVGQGAGTASRWLGRGHGSVIGGRIAMLIDPAVIEHLTAGRPVTIVSGTNGKTTTTRLVAEALRTERVVASTRGANMPQGMVGALAAEADELVLEVDEIYLPGVAAATKPTVLLLLNLTRDQLDRITEIRRVAELWRTLMTDITWPLTVVANADDPLVAWSVATLPGVVWVSAGGRWSEDAALCPSCGRVRSIEPGRPWHCACGFNRPDVAWWLDDHVLHGPDGFVRRLQPRLPGSFNLGNAAMAVAAAAVRGVDPHGAAAGVEAVHDVAGRYATVNVAGHATRLLLAKNPAGWSETLELLLESRGSLVVCINARSADGTDPSWLWDVPFERLAGRTVIAGGDRRLDLAVRLEVAGVAHIVVDDVVAAIAALPAGPVEVAATYTAFHDLLEALHVAW